MNKDVLIFDSDELNQAIYEDQLIDTCQPIFVESTEVLFKVLDESKISLLILKTHLPGTNGYSLCKEIKNNIKYKDLKIIFVTAAASDTCKQDALDSGADGYLSKPYNEDDLIAMIENTV